MAGKLDTQGWIDATRNGRAYAFFLRNEILWVRRNGKYKRTRVSGIDTIAGGRALAGSIAGEKEDWVDEARAQRAGCPATNRRSPTAAALVRHLSPVSQADEPRPPYSPSAPQ